MQLPDVPTQIAQGLYRLLLQTKLAVERWGNARKYFFAYDAAGGLTLPTDWVDVKFDTVKIVDRSLFSYASGAVTVSRDCRILIDCEMTAEATSTTRYYAAWRLVKDVGGGFSEISGSRAYSYCRTTAVPYGSASIRMLLDVRAGTKIKLQGESTHDTEVETTADTCRISIRRVIHGD